MDKMMDYDEFLTVGIKLDVFSKTRIFFLISFSKTRICCCNQFLKIKESIYFKQGEQFDNF